MAKWDKIGSLGKVTDRRGLSGGLLGGGAGLVGVLVVFALGYFGINVDPALVNQVIGTIDSSQNQTQSEEFAGNDEYEQFAGAVLGSANDYWSTTLESTSTPYSEPTLVLFRDTTQSGCGVAASQYGPHYCPSDQTIYIDERFFDELQNKLGATGGDTAEAYVIAHEVGHHVQNVTGTMRKVQSDPNYRQTGDNSLSVRLELQADCYAGLWAHSLRDQGVFESGDIEEAMDAASTVGDDNIQRQTGGTINPETWTHGSSEDRKAAFNRGFSTGNLSECSL